MTQMRVLKAKMKGKSGGKNVKIDQKHKHMGPRDGYLDAVQQFSVAPCSGFELK